jgi:hypothetical protein
MLRMIVTVAFFESPNKEEFNFYVEENLTSIYKDLDRTANKPNKAQLENIQGSMLNKLILSNQSIKEEV